MKGIKIGDGIKIETINGRPTVTVDKNTPLYQRKDFEILEGTTDFWGEYTLAK